MIKLQNLKKIIKQKRINNYKIANKIKRLEIDFSKLYELDNYIGIILPSDLMLKVINSSYFDFNFEDRYMKVNRLYLSSKNDVKYIIQFTFDDNTCVDILFGCLVWEQETNRLHKVSKTINLSSMLPQMNIEYHCNIKYPLHITEHFKWKNNNKRLFFYERDLSGGHETLADMIEYLIIEETDQKKWAFIAMPIQIDDIKTKNIIN